MSTGRSSGTRRLLLWIERALMLAGAALLAWVALLAADSWIAQRLAREAMRDLPYAAATAPEVHGRPVVIPRGAPIGELTIPRVHLSAMVLHGSDTRTLRRGPGHIENTAVPGQPGNVAIAGHRDTFFRPVKDVRVGDDIYLDTREGRFHYRVASLDVVDPHDMSVLDATETNALTLVTCFPFWVAGPAPDRFVVRAYEVDRAEAVETMRRAIDAASVDPSGEAPVAARSGALGRSGVMSQSTPDRAPSTVRTGMPPEVAVHEAIERFRLSYNGRIAKRRDLSGHPIRFGGCAIELFGASASGSCYEVPDVPGGESPRWIFSLRAEDGAWHIVAVEPR